MCASRSGVGADNFKNLKFSIFVFEHGFQIDSDFQMQRIRIRDPFDIAIAIFRVLAESRYAFRMRWTIFATIRNERGCLSRSRVVLRSLDPDGAARVRIEPCCCLKIRRRCVIRHWRGFFVFELAGLACFRVSGFRCEWRKLLRN